MSAPLVPSPLDYVGRRRFSFYPPIRNTEPNDWLLGTSSWAEVQVINAHSGLELWIPRQYVCGVSGEEEMRLVVELTKELDRGSNGVGPRVKRVIEMPRVGAVAGRFLKRNRLGGPAPVVAIRLEHTEPAKDRYFFKVLLVAVVLSVLAALLATIARMYLPQTNPRPAVATGRE
jgi:hypothetical protein